MTSHPMRLRLTALATASAMALATAPAAWSAPPPIAPRGDPPNRVARLARVNGSVSYHTADADRWSPASLNYPIRSGDAFWTEPGARADIQLAVNRLAMAPSTELDITGLDDHTLATSEPQGESYIHLRQVPAGDSYTMQTPRGTVQITATGRYDVVAGDADHPTLVTVVDGAAQVSGPNLSLQVGPRQTATITGSDTLQGSVGPMTQDPFLTAMLAEEKPAPRATVPIPPFVQEMTGAEDLDTVGQWQETPDYGAVWYPPVDAGWVPYRHGHWAYVAPWGWTWVDDAPWGFAPFHYGRWAQVDNRWGWIPVTPGAAVGPVPVYAPALVNFVDLGGAALAGAAVGFAAGALAGRSVGWVPLGPREPYYPPYRANLPYVRSLNAPNIQNVNQAITRVTVVNNRTVVNNFVNRGAATVVPAAAMLRSAPIAAAARPVPPQQLAQDRALYRAPLAPGAATAGVTPAVARQFNFVPPGRAAQPAPGPAIRPAGMPGARPGLPPLRPAGAPVAAPNEPGRPPEARPGSPAAEPGRPPEALGRPGAPPAEAGRPAEMARPGAPPAEPGRPPEASGRPGAPPTEPGRPAEAARPGAPPAEPGRAPEAAGRPGAPPAEAGRPAAEAARPGAPPTQPGRPPEAVPHAGVPGQPARPMEAPRAGPPPAAARPEIHAAPPVPHAAPPPVERPRPPEAPRAPQAVMHAPPPQMAHPQPPPAAHAPPPPAARPAPPPSHPAAPPPRPGGREEHHP